MKHTRLFRAIAAPFAIAAMTLSASPVAHAQFGIDIPSPGSVMDDIEQRYHIDQASVQTFAEAFNVSENKAISPEVSIFFSPSDPREGEKITAKAFPMYFSNPNSHLYYTWYLKREGCELGSASGKPEYCNADGSGNITVNDWKVSAMRLLTTDGADSAGFNYGGDDDGDGYGAEFGGAFETYTSHDYCYLNEPSSGDFYELTGCRHMFPQPTGTGQTSGDGTFGLAEERFWGSNPHDPDTADNGNKDEANVVGLGQDTFVWNYMIGDMVGVVVEGTTMLPTKHDNSSMMIMYAFSQNKCDIASGTKDSYTEQVKGWDVNFATTSMDGDDFDDCLAKNLVDPFEGGQGKSQKLEVSVVASPEHPMNDQEEGFGGDTILAGATVDNSARAASELSYSWKVELSSNPVTGFQDITARLLDEGLIPVNTGNGLDRFSVALNMDKAFLDGVGVSFSTTDPLYMRIAVTVQENFSSSAVRTGKSDVIVRIANTDKKIVAYSTTAAMSGTSAKVNRNAPICDIYYPEPASTAEAMENLNRISCRVIRNEIIGVYVDPTGLADFSWTINGSPLRCSDVVSTDASCTNGNSAYFAVSGNVGETYTVRMEATNVETGKSVSLTRNFQIVDPEIIIETNDATSIWPLPLGTFTELDGTMFEDSSNDAFETYGNGPISFQAHTIPRYVSELLSSFEWSVDGTIVAGTYDAATGTYRIDHTPEEPKTTEEVYTISFSGVLAQPMEKRQALSTLFGIDAIGSSNVTLSKGIQLQVVSYEEYAAEGSDRFLATVSRYVPPFVLFAFRMFATAALILFTVGFVFSLMPQAARSESAERHRLA